MSETAGTFEAQVLVIGARVTVRPEANIRELRGRSGTIVAIDFSRGRTFPYKVAFDGKPGPLASLGAAWWPMAADELVIES